MRRGLKGAWVGSIWMIGIAAAGLAVLSPASSYLLGVNEALASISAGSL